MSKDFKGIAVPLVVCMAVGISPLTPLYAATAIGEARIDEAQIDLSGPQRYIAATDDLGKPAADAPASATRVMGTAPAKSIDSNASSSGPAPGPGMGGSGGSESAGKGNEAPPKGPGAPPAGASSSPAAPSSQTPGAAGEKAAIAPANPQAAGTAGAAPGVDPSKKPVVLPDFLNFNKGGVGGGAAGAPSARPAVGSAAPGPILKHNTWDPVKGSVGINRKDLPPMPDLDQPAAGVMPKGAHDLEPGGHVQTLKQALQETVNTNPEIRRRVEETRATGKQISIARAGYLPTFDINGGYGYESSNNPSTRRGIFGGAGGCSLNGNRNSSLNNGHAIGATLQGLPCSSQQYREETGATAKQMIFDGFSTSNEVRRFYNTARARAFAIVGEVERVGLTAVEAYLNVLRRQELVAIAESNFDLHLKTNDQIQIRSKQGVGRMADVDQATGRLARAEANLQNERGNLLDARTTYLRVIGQLPPDGLQKPVLEKLKPLVPKSLEESTLHALAEHPVIHSAEADVDAAVSQQQTAKAAFMPRLDLESGASYNANLDGVVGSNADAWVMVRMRYNIFKGGGDKARVEETAYRVSEANEVLNLARRQTQQGLRFSWTAYHTLAVELGLLRNHYEKTVKSHEAYVQQFAIGERTLLDLLDTANEMYVAGSNYINGQYDLIYSVYRILAAQGDLHTSLKVALPQEAVAPPKE
jgi:adhesin transport system outer membrane protein